EVLQDLAPVALVLRAAPVALVHDDQVEEVARILLIQTRPPFIPRDGLVSGEVHLAAVDRLAVLDLVARVGEQSEILVLRVVDQDIPVRQEEDAWVPIASGGIPAAAPE